MAQIDPRTVRQMDPSQTWHALYDRLHPYWTSSLVGAISTSALLAVAAATLVQLATGKRPPTWRWPRDIRLILPIMAVAFGIGFLVVPWVEPAGIAHLSLQPICIILLLLLLMGVLGGPRWGEVILDALVGRRAGGHLARYAASHRLEIAGALIAAAAATAGLRLWSLNRRDYPMPDLAFYEPRG